MVLVFSHGLPQMEIKRALAGIAIMLVIGLVCFLGMQATIALIGYSMDADSVECDWISCSFKKTIKEADCYQNGEPINCTEMVDMREKEIPQRHG
jgi:hypothetical protein